MRKVVTKNVFLRVYSLSNRKFIIQVKWKSVRGVGMGKD